jgi:hypothetical protein
MREKNEKQARQGDVFFEVISELPKNVKPYNSPIMAYGEVTGHCHQVIFPSVDEYESYVDTEGNIYLKSSQEIKIGHDEHDCVTLAPNELHCVTIQREYDPQAAEKERRVAD